MYSEKYRYITKPRLMDGSEESEVEVCKVGLSKSRKHYRRLPVCCMMAYFYEFTGNISNQLNSAIKPGECLVLCDLLSFFVYYFTRQS